MNDKYSALRYSAVFYSAVFYSAVFYSAIFLLILFGATACGKRMPPRPPEAFRPGKVSGFTLFGVAEGIIVSWSATEKVSARETFPVTDFIVERREIGLEATREDSFSEIGNREVQQSDPATGGYSLIDRTVEPSKKYEYRVLVENSASIRSLARPLRVEFNGNQSRLLPVEDAQSWQDDESEFSEGVSDRITESPEFSTEAARRGGL